MWVRSGQNCCVYHRKSSYWMRLSGRRVVMHPFQRVDPQRAEDSLASKMSIIHITSKINLGLIVLKLWNFFFSPGSCLSCSLSPPKRIHQKVIFLCFAVDNTERLKSAELQRGEKDLSIESVWEREKNKKTSQSRSERRESGLESEPKADLQLAVVEQLTGIEEEEGARDRQRAPKLCC